MSQPAYLIKHGRNKFNDLDAALAAMLTFRGGSALVAVSEKRSILPAVCATEIESSNAAISLERILRNAGALDIRPIGEAEIEQLLIWRDPAELPVRLFQRVPNDKKVVKGYDWHLVNVGLPAAWKELRDDDLVPETTDYGEVIVGHIDTGFSRHPCLGWSAGSASPWVLTDRDRNFFFDELQPPPDSLPDYPSNPSPDSAEDPLTGGFGGHGTRTASVLSGYAPEAPDGAFYGAAPRVRHIPVRISNSVFINNVPDGLISALAYLIEQGCQVITMSMGAGLPAYLPPRVQDQIDRVYQRGILYICAAGNQVGSVCAPARNPRTIAVGGSTWADLPWSGSCRGMTVDICAPADEVRRGTSRLKRKFSSTVEFTYGEGDGTSFATQLVGGTAALWLAKHAAALKEYPEPWQRVAAFTKLLKSTARKPVGWDAAQYGAGILQADALLKADLPVVSAWERDAS